MQGSILVTPSFPLLHPAAANVAVAAVAANVSAVAAANVTDGLLGFATGHWLDHIYMPPPLTQAVMSCT